MTLEKVSDYVTCGELIDRLGCLTIEFVKGIRRGIVPKPTSEAGGSRTAETDPAFYDPSLMPSVDEWAKYVRAAKIFRFFAESSWPRMVHELGHCWEVVETATTPPTTTTTTEPGHDQQVEERESTTITLQTIPGTAWDQIRIRIAKNDRYEILRPGFQMEFFNAHELGLQKARIKLALLKAFGLNGGELKKDMTKEVSPANMSNLRKHISGIFAEVKGDPIPISEDGRYVCRFQICVNEEEFSREHYTSDDIAGEGNDWEEIMGAQR
ncbi:hypothetical protein MASR1M90_23610 [Desulfovibrionales bacterium]